jgi:hypothetical protein
MLRVVTDVSDCSVDNDVKEAINEEAIWLSAKMKKRGAHIVK